MDKRNFVWKREAVLAVVAILAVVLPVVAFGSGDTIFVDDSASGSETGSSSHPYKTISEALKHADEGDSVVVAKGHYEENITIPKDVKLVGRKKDRNDVVIKADNNDKPTVEMKHKSEINYVTIEGGRYGIRVLDDSKAKINDVLVKGSKRDGIHIDSASRDKKYRVLIDSVRVTGSKMAGIFSKRRDIVIIDTESVKNDGDGLDLQEGVKAWIEGSKFSENKGSGAVIVLDRSDVWTKKNSFRDNGREGIEVNAYSVGGAVGIKKATIKGNDRYGIARVSHGVNGPAALKGLILGTEVNANSYADNTLGDISPIIRAW